MNWSICLSSIGDMVSVHWGNCNWEGDKGVDWGYAPGIIMGEIRYWNKDAEANKSSVCGEVDVLVHGEIASYNIGRCKQPGYVREAA